MADIDPKIDRTRSRPGYDDDFAAWIYHQADALKAGRFDELDIEELADEVESLAKRDFRKLKGALQIVLLHMLKWDYQPERRGESWRTSIRDQREAVLDELKESPSFKGRLEEAIAATYLVARRKASNQTGVFLQLIPLDCPYSWTEIMTRLHELGPDILPYSLREKGLETE